jgi:anti-anti-sigma factor
VPTFAANCPVVETWCAVVKFSCHRSDDYFVVFKEAFMATVNVEQTQSGVVLKIDGRFDFNLHGEFRDAYEGVLREGDPSKFIIDMAGTEYMDSSALGMLLILRDRLGCNGDRQVIVNCNKDILEILQVSNFDKLFTIQ